MTDNFKPNTLESLHMYVYKFPSAYTGSELRELFYNQESLSRLSWPFSTNRVRYTECGLKEFGRVYKKTSFNILRESRGHQKSYLQSSQEDDLRNKNIKTIWGLLEDGRKYIQLQHVILDEKHLVIERPEIDVLEVAEVN